MSCLTVPAGFTMIIKARDGLDHRLRLHITNNLRPDARQHDTQPVFSYRGYETLEPPK